MMDCLALLHERRSYKILSDPAPSGDQIKQMLDAAVAAPDHGKLRPWRFVVLRGSAKDAFGEVMADAYRDRCIRESRQSSDALAQKQREKLNRAPVIIVVAAVRRDNPRISWVEQISSGAAAAQNICLAATALGFGSMWRTGEAASEERVMAAFGLDKHDAILGFIHVGTIPAGAPQASARDDSSGETLWWEPS